MFGKLNPRSWTLFARGFASAVLAVVIAGLGVLLYVNRYYEPKTPQGYQVQAAAAEIRQRLPLDGSQFRIDRGTTGGRVTDKWTLPWNEVTGDIYPHSDSPFRGLYPGKVLARLKVNKKYRGFAPGVWYVWAVVDTSSDRTGKLASIYIPESGTDTAFLGHLTMNLHRHVHSVPLAMWAKGSDGVGWASCTMYGCCCGDVHCEKRSGP